MQPLSSFETDGPGRYAAALSALLFTLVIAIAGCQTAPYPVPPGQGEPAAFIVFPTAGGGIGNVVAQKIDDNWIPSLSEKLRIAVGTHEILLTCEYTDAFFARHYFNRELLRFTARGGHTYNARVAKGDNRRCEIELIDSRDKTVVSETIRQYTSPLQVSSERN
jgi:hypothetical protein